MKWYVLSIHSIVLPFYEFWQLSFFEFLHGCMHSCGQSLMAFWLCNENWVGSYVCRVTLSHHQIDIINHPKKYDYWFVYYIHILMYTHTSVTDCLWSIMLLYAIATDRHSLLITCVIKILLCGNNVKAKSVASKQGMY